MNPGNDRLDPVAPARHVLRIILLGGALVILPARAQPAAGPEGAGDATGGRAGFLEPCESTFLKGEPLCGSVAVFEDRLAGTGRKIDLHVMVLPALEKGSARPQALVYLAGGPGGAATDAAPVFEMLMPDLRKRFDIVMVDQRGTGKSNPLQCTYGSFDEAARAVLLVDLSREKLTRCREGFPADLRHYTTPLAADDLDDVREALGYPSWNLFGQSYGSRTALVYLRRHPERARTVVLQGAVPTTLHMPSQLAADVDAALHGMLRDCSRDASCRASFPGLAEKLREVVERLDRSPAWVDLTDPYTGEPGRLRMDRNLYVATLRLLMHSSQLATLVPLAVEGAHRGDFSTVLPALTQWTQGMARGFHIGLYLSVVCTEDVPLAGLEALEGAHGTLTGAGMVQYHRRACEGWPTGALPPGYSSPVTSAVPALILSGEADPMTGPRWGRQVAATLANSLHLIVPNAGHVDTIGACEQRIMADFVVKGTLDALDTGCASEGRPRSFPPAPAAGS